MKSENSEKIVFISIPLWGENFWQTFLNGLWLDFFEKDNIPFFVAKGFKVIIHFSTDKDGMERVSKLPVKKGVIYQSSINGTLSEPGKHKLDGVALAQSEGDRYLQKSGGGILIPLCADMIITKGLFKNTFEHWEDKKQCVFVMQAPGLKARMFDRNLWRKAPPIEQVNEMLRTLDDRFHNAHWQSNKFGASNHSLLIYGDPKEGVIFTGTHWQPLYIRVQEEGHKDTSQFQGAADMLGFNAPDVSDDDILFFHDSSLGAFASVSNDDLLVNFCDAALDPFLVAFCIKTMKLKDSGIPRMYKPYAMLKDGKPLPNVFFNHHQYVARMINSAYEAINRDAALFEFAKMRRVNQNLGSFLNHENTGWFDFIARRFKQILKEAGNTPIYLYGAGEHTNALFFHASVSENIEGIFYRAGQPSAPLFKDVKLIDDKQLEEVQASQKIIVVASSFGYQNEICNRLSHFPNVTCVKLYQDE